MDRRRVDAAVRGARGGFTLVETMVASGMLLFLVLAIYESVLFCNRVAYDVKSRLAAEAIAFDTVWELYNKQLGWLRLRAQVAMSGWEIVDPEDYDVWGAREAAVFWAVQPEGLPPTNWVFRANVMWPNATGGGTSMLPRDFVVERSKSERNLFRRR